jgi:quinol monooxygenase YgiN
MKLGLLARIEAKPEHADEIAALLSSAAQLARKEGYAKTWYAYRASATTFGVLDTFDDEQSRTGHLEGALTQLQEQSKLAAPLDIRPVDLLSTMPLAGA